ncbi:tetratricopeptide repeat protein [Immundisolibacter sp.]|uniref:tetratricopeptide repeat protein n=1 Tax=Immundisolibacter sp. TaxID=1934948 RepID=UPI0035642BB8
MIYRTTKPSALIPPATKAVFWFGVASLTLSACGEAIPALPEVPQKIIAPGIAAHLQRTHRAAVELPKDVDAVGSYCMTLQTYPPSAALSVTCYEHLQGLKPDNFKWLYYQALAQGQAGQADKARATLERVLEREPDYMPARLRLGAAQLGAKQHRQAVASFQAAIKQSPRSAQAHFGLGRALEASADKDQAIKAYRQALAIAPQFGAANRGLSRLLKDAGKAGEARRYAALARRFRNIGAPEPDPLLNALRRQDQSAAAYARRADALAAKGSRAAAIKALDAALVSDPTFLPAHVRLIDLYRQQKAYDKAEFHYRKALALRPTAYVAEINYGRALQDQGQLDKAAVAYRNAIKADDTRAAGYLLLGRVLERQGSTSEALKQFRAAAKKKPAAAMAHFETGRLLLKTGQLTAAGAAFDKAAANSANPALTLLSIGNLYGEAKQPTHALSRLDQAKQRATANGQKRLLAAIEKARAKWQAGGAKPAPAKKK